MEEKGRERGGRGEGEADLGRLRGDLELERVLEPGRG